MEHQIKAKLKGCNNCEYKKLHFTLRGRYYIICGRNDRYVGYCLRGTTGLFRNTSPEWCPLKKSDRGLPCAIGDIRYAIAYTQDTRVIKVRITDIMKKDDLIEIFVESVVNKLHFWRLSLDDFLKWANFATREKAEKALKERNQK